MKKLFVMLLIACGLFTSCCNGNAKKAETKKCGDQKEMKCDKKHHCEMSPEMQAECKAFMEKWNNFENLDVEEQKTLLADAKARFDKMDAEMKARCEEGHKCAKEGDHKCTKEGDHKCVKEGDHKCCADKPCNPECCKEGQPCQKMCCKDGKQCDKPCCKGEKPEHKCAKEMCEAFKEKWNNFENLSIEEQKALIDHRMEMMRPKHHCNHGEEK